MMPDRDNESDFGATPIGVLGSGSRAADTTGYGRVSPVAFSEVNSESEEGGSDPWAVPGAQGRNAPVESAQTLRVLLAPERQVGKRRLFDHVAELFELDNRGRNNLGPRARADLRAYASLLVGVVLFEFTAWSLLFKFILDPGDFSHATLMTIPAVAAGALMARMVFWFDRQMLTSDAEGSWWRIGMAMVTRVGILAASAWATSVPMELTMFGAEIDSFNHERTMVETVKEVLDGAAAVTATTEDSIAQRDAKEASKDAKDEREKALAARSKADDLIRRAEEIEGLESSIKERSGQISYINEKLPGQAKARDDAKAALQNCQSGRNSEGKCDSSQLVRDWQAAKRTFDGSKATLKKKNEDQVAEKKKRQDRLDQAMRDYPPSPEAADASWLRSKAEAYKGVAKENESAQGDAEKKKKEAGDEERKCYDAIARARTTRKDFLREVGQSEPGKTLVKAIEKPPSGCSIQGADNLHFADKNLTFIERLEILDYLESTVRQPPAVHRMPELAFARIRQATHRGFRHESAFIELPAGTTESAQGPGPNLDDTQRAISALVATDGRSVSTFSASIQRDVPDRRPPNGRSQESADHFLQFRRIIRLVAMVIPFLIVISKFLMSRELTAYFSLKHQARNLDPEAYRVVQDDFARMRDVAAEQREADRAKVGRGHWWVRLWTRRGPAGSGPTSKLAEEET